MAEWRKVAKSQGWLAGVHTVRVKLGAREHTVQVLDSGSELELVARVPGGVRTGDLLSLLESNRRNGLAWWHVSEDAAVATSRCPRSATSADMALYLLETARLADRYELSVSEVDR